MTEPLDLGIPDERMPVLEAFEEQVIDLAGDMPSGEFSVVCLDLAIRAFRGAGLGRRRFNELVRRMWVAARANDQEGG